MLSKILIFPFVLMFAFIKLPFRLLHLRPADFEPTCSTYMIEALQTHGLFYGGFLGMKRILSCHPWGKSGYDPVPEKKCTHKH